MYLVDTTVWIDYFRQQDNAAVQFFKKLLEQEIPYGISGVIYQEILQGASSDKDFKRLQEYLSTQNFYHLQDPILSFSAAAKLYMDCRSKGITIRSTIDCLIAQVAIENNLILLHNDKDYVRIKSVHAKLKIIQL